MKVSVPNCKAGRNGKRSAPVPIPSPSDFLKSLGLAEIYLEDGAPVTRSNSSAKPWNFPALRSRGLNTWALSDTCSGEL